MRFGAPTAQRPTAKKGRAAAMTVRDRQQFHAITGRLDAEKMAQGPDTFHKIVYGTGRRMTVEVTYNDGRSVAERGAGTSAPQPRVAAKGSACTGRPQQQRTRQPSPAQRGGSLRDNPTPGRQAVPRNEDAMETDEEIDARAATVYTDEQLCELIATMSKSKVKAIERAAKAVITSVARDIGCTETSNADDYLSPSRCLDYGAHTIRLRVPTGSLADSSEDEDLAFFLAEKYFSYHFHPERGAAMMKKYFTPKRQL